MQRAGVALVFSPSDLKRAFEDFIDFIWARLRRWPDLRIYHDAHYEPTTLKRLAALHATREEELPELLCREAFVDLYQVVRRSIRISHDSYLFIQGPPGSGKTWTGARLIAALLAAGKRIGVTAPSHRAIHNLLEELERVASAGLAFTGHGAFGRWIFAEVDDVESAKSSIRAALQAAASETA